MVLTTACAVAALCAVPGVSAAAETVSGRALDAGGRPLANVRVELMEGDRAQFPGVIMQVTSTGMQGAWAFGPVPPGRYVVRIATGGRTTGVPVTVDGRPVSNVVIVAPSIAAAAMQATPTAGGILGALGGGSTAIGAAVVTAIAAGATVAVLAATDRGPFRDDQS